MKTKSTVPLFAEERKEQILNKLDECSKITVPELCAIFEVSPATIRNDLHDLETEKKLRRTHGGAISIRKAAFEPISIDKEVKCIDEKRAIAKQASDFIEDGDTIALDTGTTILELAKHITSKNNLTVITNDLQIALYLENNSNANIIIIGGSIRHGFHCSSGPLSIKCLTDYNVDKVFMATNAFSIERGFTTPSAQQAETKKALMQFAAETIMLVDNSKLGKISFAKFADISDIDKLIISKNVNVSFENKLRELSDELEIFIV